MEIEISFRTDPSDESAPPLYFWWLAWIDSAGRRTRLWEWDAFYASEEETRSEIAQAQEVDPELAGIPVASEPAHRVPE